jgi:hypothetical protein
MRILLNPIKWTSIRLLILPFLGPVFALGADLRADSAQVMSRGATSKIGVCEIRVLDAYFWRDFMPVVSRPGPDGGSPLRAKVKLRIDNSRGVDDKLSFKAMIVDEKGQTHPAAFRVIQHGGTWGGEIGMSDVRQIELTTEEGPYLPVGSAVHVEITWTDGKGDSAVVKTPVLQISRTD